MNRDKFSIIEVCHMTGLPEAALRDFIKREWIMPEAASDFDHEDVARVHLILELEHNLGVNEDAIPIVLHLIDQLHYLRGRLKHLGTIG